MVKPIINKIDTFDAMKDNIIYFSYSGIIRKVVVTIINNSTNAQVYTAEIETLSSKFTLPANSLTNGNFYSMTIAIKDDNDSTSLTSNPSLFYCYSTPTFNISNLINNQQLHTENYDLLFEYSQDENDKLKCYEIYLCDSSNNVIMSDTIYDTSNLTYKLSGLVNNTSYKIYYVCETQHGVKYTSNIINFSVSYSETNNIIDLKVENLCDGSISVSSNIIYITGEIVQKEIKYINNDECEVKNGAIVEFNKGYNINSDFIFEWQLRDIVENSTVLEGRFNNGYFKVDYLINDYYEYKAKLDSWSLLKTLSGDTIKTLDNKSLKVQVPLKTTSNIVTLTNAKIKTLTDNILSIKTDLNYKKVWFRFTIYNNLNKNMFTYNSQEFSYANLMKKFNIVLKNNNGLYSMTVTEV